MWFLGSNEGRNNEESENSENPVRMTIRSSSDATNQGAVVTSQPGTVANKARGDIVAAGGADAPCMDLSTYEQFSILHYMVSKD